MSDHSDTSAIEPEELLAQRVWVERLARRLVRDVELARDVAQEAWVVALERPPRHATRGRSLRAWLARVTRTLARDLPRGDGRRAAREERVARERPDRSRAPSTLDIVTRGAMQQRVAQAVLELEEPYRSAVLLRYLDELDGPAIAARQGTTPATARKHVSRGLEQLRERLAGELEDRGGLAGLLVLMPSRPAAAGGLSAAPIGSLLAMSVTTKLCLTLAAAAISVGLALRMSAPPGAGVEPEPEGDSEQAVAVPLPSSGVPAEGERGGLSPSQRASLTPAPLPDQGALAATRGPALTLRARVLDERGWPLPQATLAVFSEDGTLARPVSVDGDGRAELALEEPLPLQNDSFGGEALEPFLVVRASAAGYNAHRWFPVVDELRELDLGEVRLRPIRAISGRVVDLAGAGIAGVTVQAIAPSPDPARHERLELYGPDWAVGPGVVESGVDGRFEIRCTEQEGLARGRYRLWAGQRGMLYAHSPILTVGEAAFEQPIELVLRPLPAARRIDGRVIDAEGAGVADIGVLAARVTAAGEELSFSFAASADDDGCFTIPVPAGERVHLRAEVHGGSPCSLIERDLPAGSAGVVLRLLEPRRFDLIVSDEEGRAVPTPIVQLQRAGEQGSNYHRRRKDEPAGRVSLPLPDASILLEIRAEGFLPLTLGPLAPEAIGAELRCTLELPARIRGQVTAGGRPVPRAIVQLVGTRTPGELDIIQGFPTRLNGSRLQGIQTDADGRFELSILQEHEYVLYAEAKGWAATELGPLRLDTLRDEELDIELTAGGGVEGRVVVPEGESASGISVQFARGDGRVHAARTDDQGTYRIDRLTPGPWMVRASRVRREEARGGAFGSFVQTREVHEDYELPSDCEVFEAQITQYDLDLGALEVGALAVHVTLDGASARGIELHVIGAGDPWDAALGITPLGRTNPDGASRLEGLAIGERQLVLAWSTGPLLGTRVVVPIELVRGENALALSLASAPLELTLDERPPGELRLLTRLARGGVALRKLELAAGERRTQPAVLRGDVELLIAPPGEQRSDPLAWTPLASWSHGE